MLLYHIIRRLLLCVFYFVVVVMNLPTAEAVNIYLANGQSNARPQWRDAALNAIRVFDPTARIIWNAHRGTPLKDWFTTFDYAGQTGRQQYYLSDIFDPSPESAGLLENAFSNISLSGDIPVLAGFLWFQGEADSANMSYFNEFLAFRDQIAADFDLVTLPTSLAIVFDMGWPDGIAIRTQQSLLGLEEGITTFDTASFARGDGVHLSVDDLSIVGNAMGNNLMSVVAIPEPVFLPAAAALVALIVLTLKVCCFSR